MKKEGKHIKLRNGQKEELVEQQKIKKKKEAQDAELIIAKGAEAVERKRIEKEKQEA